MKKPGNRSSTGLRVSASDLAKMGVCERLVVFEHCYGKRRTRAQHHAIRRGQLAHLRFYRERNLGTSVNARSLIAVRIASVLYGWLRRAVRIVLWPVRWCSALWGRAMEGSDGP